MRDVAREAGVGIKTVSRVVNDEPGVSAELSSHIRKAIAKLGFRRNNSARVLKQGVSESIGLVCGDVAEPFQSQLIRAVEEVAVLHGSMLIVSSSANDANRERDVVHALCSRQVDGLIIAPAGPNQTHLQPEIETGVPMVFVDRPPRGATGDVVLADNTGGVEMGIRHLLKRGHERIGFVGDHPALFTQIERLEAYRRTLLEHGLPIDEALISMQVPDPNAVEAALGKMLDIASPATAIMTGNALCTFAALRCLAARERRPALVGFDDFALADLLVPGVSVVAQDPASMGRIAADLLFRRISGDSGPTQTIRLGTRLIERGTGEIAMSK